MGVNDMKIALVWPKSTFLSEPMTWPPLGLWYLAAQLEAQGHSTEFFDLSFTEMPKDGEFDQLWLSATSPQVLEVRKIAVLTRDWKTKTVFGGAMPWANPETSKEMNFAAIVSGESDHPETVRKILELANNAENNDAKIFYAPVISKTLDWVLPPVRRWALNYHSYMTDDAGNKYRMASLFTSRGCPLECAFCESGRFGVIWDRLTRYESLDIVEQQIAELDRLGFTGLAYYDDILPLNKKRTIKIMELHRKYNKKFRCFLRSDIICNHGGKEYLELLKDGGLIEIFVGVESADNQIKDNIHKKTTIEQDTAVLEWCRELGITFKGSFILGLPGETMESMEKTRAWILALSPEGVRIQVDRLIPFPGTPLTKNPGDYDLVWENRLDEEWFYKGRSDLDLHSFVSTSHLTKEQIDNFWHKLDDEMRERGFRA